MSNDVKIQVDSNGYVSLSVVTPNGISDINANNEIVENGNILRDFISQIDRLYFVRFGNNNSNKRKKNENAKHNADIAQS